VAPFVDFEDRIAVVTGGASGIGRELLLQLAQEGTHVSACDIDREALEESARRARSANPEVRVATHMCDVSDKAEVARFADEVAQAHASDAIHLLFNNAGIVGGSSFVTGSREEWERTFAVSWFGVYYCTRSFLPMLLAADRGVVVNTSSVNGVWASLGPGTAHTAYSSAKSAVNGFTESLIGDFHRNAPHLSAVLVIPGHVRTGMSSPPRSWGRSVRSLGVDYRPVTAKTAAAKMIQAIRNGEWRVVIGDDAEAIDAFVRRDPWSAYDQS
jgi:NAD(P)-dependent dehydrogenase (short-subunit alcohol dehydrogenase family)